MAMNEYSKKVHLKANDVARKLLQKFSEQKDLLVQDNLEPTPEEQRTLDEQTTDFALGIMQMLAVEEVKINDATFALDKIMGSINGLKQYIGGQLRVYEDEYLSRSYGIKNDEGKYRKEEVTIGQLMVKLSEVRENTGNNKNDFYNEIAPEMPTDGSIPSPFVK
ncbi:MAG: hypothetical protein ACP5N7_01955 [Candidatus Pacearchaeota archaeon]